MSGLGIKLDEEAVVDTLGLYNLAVAAQDRVDAGDSAKICSKRSSQGATMVIDKKLSIFWRIET